MAVDGLSRELAELRQAAGRPTYAKIVEHCGRNGVPVSKSSLAEWLSGKSVPESAKAFGLVVQYLTDLAGRRIRGYEGKSSPQWEALRQRAREERRTGQRAADRPSPALWLTPTPEPGYIDRPDVREALVAALAETGGDRAPATVLHGTAGFGKTTLALQACRLPEVKALFPGGALWVTLGETARGPDLAARINELVTQLTGDRPALSDPQQAGLRLGAVLDAWAAPMLLVVDDAWHDDQVRPFLEGGLGCRRLFTTRHLLGSLAHAGRVPVDELTGDQARSLLTRGLDGLPDSLVDDLTHETGGWALLAGIVNSTIAERQGPDGLTEFGALIIDGLRTGGPTALDSTTEDHRRVAATMETSLQALPEETRDRYLELGIFAEDTAIPMPVLTLLWAATGGMSRLDTELRCDELHRRGLVQRREPIQLHDVIREYVRRKAGPERLARWHDALASAAAGLVGQTADGTPAWWSLPDEHDYLYRHLVGHLRGAGRSDEADRLVTDLRWIAARVRRYGPVAIEVDLAGCTHPAAAALTAAIRHNGHLLTAVEPPEAVADIMVSRCEGSEELRPVLDAYRPSGRHRLVNRWLPPDRTHPALRRAIRAGHLRESAGFAFLAGSDRLLSVGNDGLLRIWDTTTGDLRHTVEQGERIVATRVGADGTWFATSCYDAHIVVCDAATLAVRADLHTGVRGGYQAWAVAPDAGWTAVVESRRDSGQPPVLRVWDLPSGDLRFSADTGHDREVCQMLVPEAGGWLATVSWPPSSQEEPGHDVRIWDVASGALRYVAEVGHVWGPVAAPDGSWLAFVDTQSPLVRDRGPALVVVETGAETGRLRHVIETRHRFGSGNLTVSPDGALLVTADYVEDGPDSVALLVQAWDSVTGQTRWSAESSHRNSISQVAVAPAGTWLATRANSHTVPASNDPLVPILDTATGAVRQQIDTGHRRGIQGLAVSPDSTLLATTDNVIGHVHYEGVIRIWDVSGGSADHAVDTGYEHGVGRLAAAANDSWLATIDHAESGDSSGDPVVRICDARTGRPVRVIDTGHTFGVRELAAVPAKGWLATTGHPDPGYTEDDDEDDHWAVGDPIMRLWDPVTGDLRMAIDTGCTSGIRQLVVGPDGTWIATTGRRGPDRPDGADLFEVGHWDDVTGAQELFGGPGDPLVQVWDVTTGDRRLVIDTLDPRGVRRIVAGPDGSWLATTVRIDSERHDADDDAGVAVSIWDSASGSRRLTIHTGHSDGVDWVVADPAGDWIATSGLGALDATVQIWNAGTGVLRHTIETGHRAGVRHAVAGPAGDWIATAGEGRVQVWDPRSGRCRCTMNVSDRHGVRHLAVLRDGELVTVGLHTVQVWSPDGLCLAANRVDGDIYRCLPLQASPGVVLGGVSGLYAFDLLNAG